MISLAVINIPEAFLKLTTAVKWHDFAILKILFVFLLVYYGRSIFRLSIGISKMAVE